jgi:hypothetical protein
VVGVLANGSGPAVLLRCELDALPLREESGAPYASTAVICCGAASPPNVAARLAMAVSIGITGAGTGEPALTGEAALAGETAQPAAASPDTRARTDASAAAA